MNEQTSEALRAWFKRIEPLYPELFNTAHVICGNYDQAEYALRSAIVEVWSQNSDAAMGFREKLRGAVRQEAFAALREDTGAAEFTWPGFTAGDDTLLRLAARERIETQRILMLKHGVGLSAGRIAQLTGGTASSVRTALDRFESRARRSLTAQERSRFDTLFQRAAKRQLASRENIPHPSAVYRTFEAEASQLQLTEHRVSRAVYRALMLVAAVVCAAAFWLFAVLVQSPTMEAAPTSNVIQPEPTAADPFTEALGGADPFQPDAPVSIDTTYGDESPGT